MSNQIEDSPTKSMAKVSITTQYQTVDLNFEDYKKNIADDIPKKDPSFRWML